MPIYSVVAVKDLVIFPGVIAPVFISRQDSVKALQDAAFNNDTLVFVTAQKKNNTSSSSDIGADLYRYGTLCKILQSIRLPDGALKVILEGCWRSCVSDFYLNDGILKAEAKRVNSQENILTKEAEALCREIRSEFETYAALNHRMPDEVIKSIEDIQVPGIFADIVASHSTFDFKLKQGLLEEVNVIERLEKLLSILLNENEILALERNIHEKVHSEMDKGQRQYYLREQLKIIHEELGDTDSVDETEALRDKSKEIAMPDAVREKLDLEIDRYSRMTPISPEATVARSYIDWLMCLPWYNSSEDTLDINNAKKMLDSAHYGLSEIKERIIEFLAVRKLAAENTRAQVICFIGAPGVGKTSLGKSIAKAMGRSFVSMSLGGLRDEAEIRGHRRTYVGALPGRIIQKIKQAGTNNPVLLMDEIDKIGADFRGDPAAALLEVLDPEQNCIFSDNFLEVPFDLSKVVFITTANNISTIPRPLLDRMELIYLPGYLTEEKVKIAKIHLMPRILKESGLSADSIVVPDAIIKDIISSYTIEAGVRGLDRELSKIARKVAVRVARKRSAKHLLLTRDILKSMLGAPKIHRSRIPLHGSVGTAIGLAWTETGGSVLIIEAAVMAGKGHVSYTGNLGDIMQESADTALAYLRSHSAMYGLDDFEWQKTDIHIHVPEGAVPKDGPSAGVTIALALCSALTGKPVDVSFAMTGEMTLHGDVLPIGGIREKMLAAKRRGIRKLIVPEDNRTDVEDLSKWISKGIEIHYVANITEVFDLALEKRR